MQMQILIAFTGCRDMARPSMLWPFGGMKLPFLCCAHCLFPMLEYKNLNLFPPRPNVPVRSYLIDCSSLAIRDGRSYDFRTGTMSGATEDTGQ